MPEAITDDTIDLIMNGKVPVKASNECQLMVRMFDE